LPGKYRLAAKDRSVPRQLVASPIDYEREDSFLRIALDSQREGESSRRRARRSMGRVRLSENCRLSSNQDVILSRSRIGVHGVIDANVRNSWLAMPNSCNERACQARGLMEARSPSRPTRNATETRHSCLMRGVYKVLICVRSTWPGECDNTADQARIYDG